MLPTDLQRCVIWRVNRDKRRDGYDRARSALADSRSVHLWHNRPKTYTDMFHGFSISATKAYVVHYKSATVMLYRLDELCWSCVGQSDREDGEGFPVEPPDEIINPPMLAYLDSL